ncbi:restriction endonuclease subunit S [Microcystis elabens FACHB-917]|nr:restriction endonuclease subunit S [Microcystis elabens FACHB-917]
MAELRPGWRRVKFGEMAECINDRVDNPAEAGVDRYVGLEHLDRESLKIRRWGSPDDVESTKLRFRPGDIIFGKRRAYQRKLAVADSEGICSAHAMVLRAKAEAVFPDFLPYFMQSDPFMRRAVEISVGSLSPTINWKTLAQQEFGIPPLEEQLRITSALKAIDHARQCAREATESLQDVRLRSYIDCTTKGIWGDRERQMTESPLGLIPANWKCVELGKAARILNRLRKPISSSERSKIPGPYPYYGPTGILDRISEYRLEGEYVLLGEDGDHFLKWRSWSMTQLTKGRFNVNNHAHILEGTTDCRTRWIYHFFRHRSINEWLTKQGAGRLKLKPDQQQSSASCYCF